VETRSVYYATDLEAIVGGLSLIHSFIPILAFQGQKVYVTYAVTFASREWSLHNSAVEHMA